MTLTNLCFFSSLLTFFVLGSKVTKYKAKEKKKFEDNFKEGKSTATTCIAEAIRKLRLNSRIKPGMYERHRTLYGKAAFYWLELV